MTMDAEVLFSAFLDGRRLTQDERAHLSAWVTLDPAAPERVVQMTIVHEWLADRMSFLKLLDDLSTLKDPELQEEVSSALNRFVLASESLAPSASPTALTRPTRRRFSTRQVVAIGSLAAALVLAFMLGKGDSSRPAGVEIVATQPIETPGQAPTVPPPPPPLARVEEAIDARFMSPGSSKATRAEVGAPATPGNRIELVQGLVQWQTAAGHLVVAEAPAVLRWRSATRLDLESGKVVGRAAPEADPLVVGTPTAEVVDLGTEFGVAFHNSNTDVVVYDGEVELFASNEGAQASDETKRSTRIPKGFRSSLAREGVGDVTPIRFDREFVRPDEVLARRLASEGSASAAADVRWFELQRVPGLLAYQGFDAASEGGSRTIGCAPMAVERGPASRFAPDLLHPTTAWSRSFEPEPGDPAVLLLDVSPGSRAASADLIDVWGTIGKPGREVWLSWEMQPSRPDESDRFAGVAILFGPERVQNEPLFLGRPEGYRKAGLLRHGDSPFTGLKGGESAEGRWVARFVFGEPRGRVEVWRGVAPQLTGTTPPHAERELADLRFDRLGVGSGADAAPWRFDDFVVTDTREALVKALAVLSAPVLEAATQPGPGGAPKERRE